MTDRATLCWVCETRPARGSGNFNPTRCLECSAYTNPYFYIDTTHALALANMRHAGRLTLAGANADAISASHAQVMQDVEVLVSVRNFDGLAKARHQGRANSVNVAFEASAKDVAAIQARDTAILASLAQLAKDLMAIDPTKDLTTVFVTRADAQAAIADIGVPGLIVAVGHGGIGLLPDEAPLHAA